MTKGNAIYYLFLLLCLTVLVLFEYFSPKPVDWSRTFLKDDKIPYGTYLLYRSLEQFAGSPVALNQKTFYEWHEENTDQGEQLASAPKTLYFSVGENFEFEGPDAAALLTAVENGSCAFLAANRFFGPVADSLGSLSVIPSKPFQSFQDSTKVCSKLVNPLLDSARAYCFKDGLASMVFSFDSLAPITVLGELTGGAPDFVKVGYGQGFFLLHANPLLFTNYQMLSDEGRDYVEKALSYLPPNLPVLWDEHYNPAKPQTKTLLRFVLGAPALKWAYFTALAAMLLFLYNGSRRRQRAIPVYAPPANDTLDYTQTIGHIYYQRGNHHDLAKKKATYFKESLRARFALSGNPGDEGFLELVAAKTGVPFAETQKLYALFDWIEHRKYAVTESDLLRLNRKIEAFNNKL